MSWPSRAPTDDAVWRDALGGSTDAWGQLFLRHNRAIYNFCFRRTGQWSVAEDLTSVVFLEAWRRRSSVQLGSGSALPWLYGIATLLTRNHHRTLRRHQAALQRIPFGEPEPDPADDVAVRVDAERRIAQIRIAVRQLRQKDVDLLDLAAAGLSYPEIAAALSIPEGTVKSRLSRVRQRLGQMIGDPPPVERKDAQRVDARDGASQRGR